MEKLKVSGTSREDTRKAKSLLESAPKGYASLKAGQMFGCYRKQDANDPDIYVAAVSATLNEFPPSIIDFVVDPRTGLPSRLKWLPTVAEVREACETQLSIAQSVLRLQQMAQEKRAVLASSEATLHQKSAAAEWLDRIETRSSLALPSPSTTTI